MIQVHGHGSKKELNEKSWVGWAVPCKINIRYKKNTISGEGIWARPCTEEDSKAYDSSKAGVEFFVYLLNSPICPDVKHGNKIKCKTTGADTRPVSAEVASSEKEYADVKNQLMGRHTA